MTNQSIPSAGLPPELLEQAAHHGMRLDPQDADTIAQLQWLTGYVMKHGSPETLATWADHLGQFFGRKLAANPLYPLTPGASNDGR